MFILSDETEVSEAMVELLPWKTGFPLQDDNAKCVALMALELVNFDCSQSFHDGKTISDLLNLAYICEARNIHSEDMDQLCHFPFSYQGKVSSNIS